MMHPAVDAELASHGKGEGDRATVTKKVIECFARADDWAAQARLVLLKTLNFAREPGMLDSRRGDLMNTLNLGDKAYRSYEEDVFNSLADRLVTSAVAPCDDPIVLLHERLAEISLDQAITYAGFGDEDLGMIRVRRLLERRLPAALATFSSKKDAPDTTEYPWSLALTRMLGVLALATYDDAVAELRNRHRVPERFAVLPAMLLPRIVGLYAVRHDREQRQLDLAREADRSSARVHRPEGREWQPYVVGGRVGGDFHRMIDNTAGFVAQMAIRVEAANTWSQNVRRARGLQQHRIDAQNRANASRYRLPDDWYARPPGTGSWLGAELDLGSWSDLSS